MTFQSGGFQPNMMMPASFNGGFAPGYSQGAGGFPLQGVSLTGTSLQFSAFGGAVPSFNTGGGGTAMMPFGAQGVPGFNTGVANGFYGQPQFGMQPQGNVTNFFGPVIAGNQGPVNFNSSPFGGANQAMGGNGGLFQQAGNCGQMMDPSGGLQGFQDMMAQFMSRIVDVLSLVLEKLLGGGGGGIGPDCGIDDSLFINERTMA